VAGVRGLPRILGAVTIAAAALLAVPLGSAQAGSNWTVKATGRGGNGRFSTLSPIQVGDTVTWRAVEGDHQVAADGGEFQSGPFAYDYEPHTYSFTFTRPGRYTYHCTVSTMTGVIEVADPQGGTTTTAPPTTTTTRELYKPPPR
jgi:plastocyanin